MKVVSSYKHIYVTVADYFIKNTSAEIYFAFMILEEKFREVHHIQGKTRFEYILQEVAAIIKNMPRVHIIPIEGLDYSHPDWWKNDGHPMTTAIVIWAKNYAMGFK